MVTSVLPSVHHFYRKISFVNLKGKSSTSILTGSQRPSTTDRTEPKPQSTPASCCAGACQSTNDPHLVKPVTEPMPAHVSFGSHDSTPLREQNLPRTLANLGFLGKLPKFLPFGAAKKRSVTIFRQAYVGSVQPRTRLLPPLRSRRWPRGNR